MQSRDARYHLRLAENPSDLLAAQALRYRVFVEELGAGGPGVDHEAKLERDRYDPVFDHLVLWHGDEAVGVYRLLRSDVAREHGGFYSQDEYDLGVLEASGRRLLELGRSCVDKRHRGGTAMFHLWNGLAEYVLRHDIEILFGVASFHGTDPDKLAEPLSYLYHHHLAPEDMRVRAKPPHGVAMNLVPADQISRKAAMVATPALIKAYLRLGGYVGEGAFVDHDFNTTDVCVLMDTARMSERHRGYYTKGQG